MATGWRMAWLLAMLAGVMAAWGADAPDLHTQFTARYQAWRDWCAQHPASSNLAGNKPYVELVALGPQAVPLLLERMEQEAENGIGASLAGAVREIAKIRLHGVAEATSNAERAGLYLRWWQERKYYVTVTGKDGAAFTHDPNDPAPPSWAPLCRTLRDRGIDVLPRLIAEFAQGYYRHLSDFSAITGGQGMPEEGTPQERADAAIAWWQAHKAEWTLPPTDAVSVQVGLQISAPHTALTFTVTNHRTWPRPTTPVATNRNSLHVVDPEGKTHDLTLHKVWDKPPVTIPPLGSHTWTWAVTPHLDASKLTTPGIYRLIWDYEGTRAPAILLIRGATAGDPPPPLPKREGRVNLHIVIPVTDTAPDRLLFAAANDTDVTRNLFDAMGGFTQEITGPDGRQCGEIASLLEVQIPLAPAAIWHKWVPVRQLLAQDPDNTLPGRYTLRWGFRSLRDPVAVPTSTTLYLVQ